MSKKEIIYDHLIKVFHGTILFSSGWIIITFFITNNGFNSEKITTKASPETKSRTSVFTEEIINRINVNMKSTQLNRELKEAKIKAENEKTTNNVGARKNYKLSASEMNRYGINLDQDNRLQQIKEDLEHRDTMPLNMRPAERIEAKIQNQKFIEDYNKQYEEQFVSEFLDKLQNAGYDVRVNDKLEIVRFKKIKKPMPILFE